MYILSIAPVFLMLPFHETYNRLLDALETIAPDFKTDKFLLRFEFASINAFQKHYPDSMLSGYCFHLMQNFVLKIGERELKKLVSENHEAALALKMIRALALIIMRK